MNPVVHFEFPYKDAGRISDFYKTVFGWELTPLGSEFGSYILATTAKTDAKPGTPAGSINGGFFPIDPNGPEQYPSIVIGVRNIEESMKAINEHGGVVLGEPQAIPNFGFYIAFYDTEGNRNSIIQPNGT